MSKIPGMLAQQWGFSQRRRKWYDLSSTGKDIFPPPVGSGPDRYATVYINMSYTADLSFIPHVPGDYGLPQHFGTETVPYTNSQCLFVDYDYAVGRFDGDVYISKEGISWRAVSGVTVGGGPPSERVIVPPFTITFGGFDPPRNYLGIPSVSGGVIPSILDQADGNPFFDSLGGSVTMKTNGQNIFRGGASDGFWTAGAFGINNDFWYVTSADVDFAASSFSVADLTVDFDGHRYDAIGAHIVNGTAIAVLLERNDL